MEPGAESGGYRDVERCGEHDLALNPEGICIRCRARAEQAQTGRRSLWVGGAAVVMTAAVLGFAISHARAEVPAAAAPPPPIVVAQGSAVPERPPADPPDPPEPAASAPDEAWELAQAQAEARRAKAAEIAAKKALAERIALEESMSTPTPAPVVEFQNPPPMQPQQTAPRAYNVGYYRGPMPTMPALNPATLNQPSQYLPVMPASRGGWGRRR